ncbi:Hcp family type VI secretion system effector [Cohnella sp. 56]|uniref:Hcp family type VI secretion system effector n=1 Tax=Cohnella sp. 56 TaxID=3113722 RepID=UPI0030EA499B
MFARFVPKASFLLLAFLIFAVASPISASAASGSYVLLTLDKISGESKVAGAKGAIDLSSFSFAAANPVSMQGSGGGAGKPDYQDLAFTKFQDSATLPLLESLTTGKSIKSGTIAFYRSQSTKPYLTIKLENIFVTSDSLSAGGDADRIAESFTLRAGKMTFVYEATDPKGQPVPAQTYEIDLIKGTKG